MGRPPAGKLNINISIRFLSALPSQCCAIPSHAADARALAFQRRHRTKVNRWKPSGCAPRPCLARMPRSPRGALSNGRCPSRGRLQALILREGIELSGAPLRSSPFSPSDGHTALPLSRDHSKQSWAACLHTCAPQMKKPSETVKNDELGRLENGPGGIRTHGLRFRKPPLYPAELRGHALDLKNGGAI